MTLAVGYKKVAETYGTKPKIAEAMQLGIVDLLTGTAAGMYLDQKMAEAQTPQAPQGTVAQQVMGGLPPAPQMAAPQQTGGLGATPQAAPPMAPQMAMPEEAPMAMAAGGYLPPYATGGLTGLPVPDNMFDEPSNGGFNDGYAGGGIVAFSEGGFGRYFEEKAKQFVPGIGVTSRQRSPDKNAQVGGVANSFHLTGEARDFVPPPGMDMDTLFKTLKAKFGSQYDVIHEGDHVHIEPGPGVAKAGAGTLLNPAGAANPDVPMDVPGGNLADQMLPAMERAGMFYDQFMPKIKTEAREKVKARLEERMSEENQKKEAKQDKWAALAEMGFNIAGANTPSFFQAVGAAATAALKGSREAKKEREARYDAAVERYAEIEGIENAEARDRVKFMMDFSKQELDLRKDDLTRGVRWLTDRMENETQLFNIRTQAASNKYATDKQFLASMAGNQAQVDAVMKQGYNLAYQAAQDEVKALPAYVQAKDEATRNRIFNEELQRKLAAYKRMVSGGAGGGGGDGIDFSSLKK